MRETVLDTHALAELLASALGGLSRSELRLQTFIISDADGAPLA